MNDEPTRRTRRLTPPGVAAWLDPEGCPSERPALGEMTAATRELHAALDAHARKAGVRWLHPEHRTIQRDLLGSPEVVAWQEAKAAFLLAGDGAWSELPHLYARYGTPGTGELIAALRGLEGARAALVTDSGMQAIALVADVLLTAGGHAVVMRQVYNKTRTFLEHTAQRIGAQVTLVDDGDLGGLAAAIRPTTQLVLAETFTNPLTRAQDIPALTALTPSLVIDSTIATPWAFDAPLLARGVRVVVGSLTKALGGQDTALGGYIATDDAELANRLMDLVAMRGGILDDERARRIAAGLPVAEAAHARRCASAARLAAFLAHHPRIERVFHPSLPDHPDAAVIARDYRRTGSLLALRVAGADEARHRHIADVLVSCVVPRYALSFDGLTTKVNHHRTVSEYFTPPGQLAALGIDRLIRIGVGIEDADDIVACVNWALHHEAEVTPGDLEAWRAQRAARTAPAAAGAKPV
ncbi:MAG TPA: PLP-dependent transferase [Kofleriaceae bacterium]|jgi:cystathionine beta-lyase/cystathionine gamma-synthase|nr:PLP-dependent transferase [Kofleriaceae bacterium]